MKDFCKFPHTPHLIWLGEGIPRSDKVMTSTEVGHFLAGEVVVEEKVDGSNLGIFVDTEGRLRAQSRGNYLAPGRSHAQWNPLWSWLAQREDTLQEGLAEDLMLFGEWCYARHSIAYDALPDWFLGFDVFDTRSRQFWSVTRRNRWLHERLLNPVPEVKRGRLQIDQLYSLLGASSLGSYRMEGIYLRKDQGEWLQTRAKVVNATFHQQIEEHWKKRRLVPNELASRHG
jgi:ATP-dependent RNA circularization protein (DNA/RNA ligase family)